MKIGRALALLAALMAGPAVAQVNVDAYVKQDRIERIKISPTGDFMAFTVPMEDRTILAIMRRSDKKIVAKAAGRKDSVVSDFWWANDERVIVSMAERLGSRDEPYATGELHAINADGSKGMALASPYGVDDPVNAGRILLELEPAVFLIDTLPGDERKVLVAAWPFTPDPVTRVETLDIYSRRRVTVATAPVRRARFAADAAGEVRFAAGYGPDNSSKLYYRDARGSDWRLVNDEAQSHRVIFPLGFSEDGKLAYLQSEMAEGPDAILSYDPASGKQVELLRDAVVDPWQTIERLGTREPAGAWFMHDGLRSRFFDETSATARLYRSLEKAFPGLAVSVTSTTRGGRLALIYVWSERSNGDYYLFDTVDKTANIVYSRREWFDPARAQPTREVELQARDGRKLYGYLTRPSGKENGALPLVVLPHGGPFSVYDQWGFDDESQMLAEAGYAVLRVNYRGSGNYGRDHLQAGAKQWGKAMQDDLTDATRWAVAQGIADPARICIYGASYGGYAALMGVAKEPELYRCAVGYVGVYDLERVYRDSRDSRSSRVWVGDWMGERDALAPVSPVNLAGRIKAPVFLAAGGKDERAPIEHSRKMEKALKAAGVPVETLYYDSEGHGFYTEAHRREYYVRLLDFLSRYLGGAKAKAG